MKTEASTKRSKGAVRRLLKTLFQFYPVLLPVTLVFIIFNGIISSIPAIFMQNVIAVVESGWKSGDWSTAGPKILTFVGILAALYVLSLLSDIVFNQNMAIITQGSLKKMRVKMFHKMESLPVSYFDNNSRGDIMSYYTNDIDTLRQMISQSIPQLLISSVTVITIFCIMVYFCLWLTLIVVVGIVVMALIIRHVGGGSAKYFEKQQVVLAEEEGFVEEIMNGEKVVKVFCHEKQSEADFDVINNKLFGVSERANKYANTLVPILSNVGNVLYVIVVFAGGALLLFKVPNVSISGLAIGISIIVPFLNMTKQFAGNVYQVSQQINAVVMGLAGAWRIFRLLDEKSEIDEGYVELVHAVKTDEGITETTERTGTWAWKHPHQADGTITYTPLAGEMRLENVKFGYSPDKEILHGITLYAEPGQKVAFVGSTGAGKTTIANLLNRFYDINDGKIRFDGININKIKKADLRHSIGIVLQETNLFTETVMENIRFGRLEAADDECIAAAKKAGADDFISRLPQGYQTKIEGNGGNLSEGQRQLLAISRAAVADPPVMILDEATSSIDTRTEAIVEQGMDALMEGRTVFVIAHRLSTVKNADVIMVMEHGRIVERGTHQQLIDKKGEYYQLYTGAFELE